MAGSLQGPPFKTPSYCIRKSTKNYRRQELLDLQCNHNYNSNHRRRQYHQRHLHPYHQHHHHHQNRKKLLQQRKRKQAKHFQTFRKLSNGCIPRISSYHKLTVTTTSTKYVLQPNLQQQISSSKFKSLASDDTILVVNHNRLPFTLCVLPKAIQ